jgi:ribosome-associated protein
LKCQRRQILDSFAFARFIVDVIEENKGAEITLLDLRPDAIIADFFVIANGTSDRQLRALTEYVRQGVKEAYDKNPYSVDGTPEGGWVLMDYGDVVVHLFQDAEREFYDIEGLWRERSQVLLSIQ